MTGTYHFPTLPDVQPTFDQQLPNSSQVSEPHQEKDMTTLASRRSLKFPAPSQLWPELTRALGLFVFIALAFV